MLNTALIENLYKGLDSKRKEELRERLFGKSRQSMAYFSRTKDITLSKLEILADFYNMPLDYFRVNGNMKTTNIHGDNNYVGNVSVSNNLLLENRSLQEQIAQLKNEVTTHKETLKRCDDYIATLKDLVIALKAQIKSCNE